MWKKLAYFCEIFRGEITFLGEMSIQMFLQLAVFPAGIFK